VLEQTGEVCYCSCSALCAKEFMCLCCVPLSSCLLSALKYLLVDIKDPQTRHTLTSALSCCYLQGSNSHLLSPQFDSALSFVSYSNPLAHPHCTAEGVDGDSSMLVATGAQRFQDSVSSLVVDAAAQVSVGM
jgi:hypothetical protein